MLRDQTGPRPCDLLLPSSCSRITTLSKFNNKNNSTNNNTFNRTSNSYSNNNSSNNNRNHAVADVNPAFTMIRDIP